MSEVEYSDESKRLLARIALVTAESDYTRLSEMVTAAHLHANGNLSREALIETFATMIADGRYDAGRLGEIGDDPDLVKAVADLVKARSSEATLQVSDPAII